MYTIFPHRVHECSAVIIGREVYAPDRVQVRSTEGFKEVLIDGELDPYLEPKDLKRLWVSRPATVADHRRRGKLVERLSRGRHELYEEKREMPDAA